MLSALTKAEQRDLDRTEADAMGLTPQDARARAVAEKLIALVAER